MTNELFSNGDVVLASKIPSISNQPQFVAEIIETNDQEPHYVRIFGERQLTQMYCSQFKSLSELVTPKDPDDLVRQWVSLLNFAVCRSNNVRGMNIPLNNDHDKQIKDCAENLNAELHVPKVLLQTLSGFPVRYEKMFPQATEVEDEGEHIMALMNKLDDGISILKDLSWLWAGTLLKAKEIYESKHDLAGSSELALSRRVFSLVEQSLISFLPGLKIYCNEKTGREVRKPDLRAVYKDICFLFEEDKADAGDWLNHPDRDRLIAFMYNSLASFFNDYTSRSEQTTITVYGLLHSGLRCNILAMDGTVEDKKFKSILYRPFRCGFDTILNISNFLGAMKIISSEVKRQSSEVFSFRQEPLDIELMNVPSSRSSRQSTRSQEDSQKQSHPQEKTGKSQVPEKQCSLGKAFADLTNKINLTKSMINGKVFVIITDKDGNSLVVKLDCSKIEQDILPSLNHPNIIRCYGYMNFSLNGQCKGIVMDYWSDFPLRWNFFGTFALQILQALKYIHNLGIIHRDIKRSNVRFHDGKLKLIDFGLATFETNNPISKCGTPDFMAPEMDGVTLYDCKVDIYSTGLMLYDEYYHLNSTCLGHTPCLWERAKINKFNDLIDGMLEEDPHTRLSAEECMKHPFFE
eukprot:gb/GECH01010743.1/.p1 GENE.gb/GECH01010743.1/~~gb/GECH01010743.1/.p1  ORF type:complete len:633 (+),score=81.15 gb/GECH01010743.1/:1-1899(+)